MYVHHRRRIKTDDKEEVAAAAWGAKLIQFLAALAILHQEALNNRMKLYTDDMKKSMNCTRTI